MKLLILTALTLFSLNSGMAVAWNSPTAYEAIDHSMTTVAENVEFSRYWSCRFMDSRGSSFYGQGQTANQAYYRAAAHCSNHSKRARTCRFSGCRR